MLQPSFCVAMGYVQIFRMTARTFLSILDVCMIWGKT